MRMIKVRQAHPITDSEKLAAEVGSVFMQIRKLSGMGLLLLLIVGIFWALYYPTVADRHSPQAAGGELDLGGWDFKRNGLADLDGEWAFYPGRLLQAGAIFGSAGRLFAGAGNVARRGQER